MEIRLAAGTYNATEPIVINLSNATRPITVRVTGVTANATVLSCSGRPIRALQIINAGATFISALTIQNCGTNNTSKHATHTSTESYNRITRRARCGLHQALVCACWFILLPACVPTDSSNKQLV